MIEVMSFPATLRCGRSITNSFIYPRRRYSACHCRSFILAEHECVRCRKFIPLYTKDGETRSKFMFSRQTTI